MFETGTDTSPDAGHWRLVTTESGLHALRQEWENLFLQNPMHSPFLAWGWVTAWLRYLAGPHELSIVVWQDEQGVAQLIIPLIVRGKTGLFGVRTVMFSCGYGSECSDYLGCLRLPQHNSRLAELTAFGITKLIDKNLHVSLTALDGRTAYACELRTIMDGLRRRTRCETQVTGVAANLPGSWDEYLQGLSPNFRSQVRRRCRKTDDEKSLEFRSVVATESKEFTEDLIRLNRQRMTHKGKKSSLEDSCFRAFLMESVPYMVSINVAWMDVLEKDRETIGAALNFVHGNTVFYYIGGIDHAAEKWGPGTALFAHVIRRCIEENYSVYDFLRGQEDYKYKWGGTDVPMYKLDIYGAGIFRGRVVQTIDNVLFRMRHTAQRLVRGE